jgi:hypothetical protein
MSALTAPLLGSECQSSGAGFIAQRGNEFIALVHRSGSKPISDKIVRKSTAAIAAPKNAPSAASRAAVHQKFLTKTD